MNILIVCEIDFLKTVTFELQELPALLSLRGHNVYVVDYESKWEKSGRFDLISKWRCETVSRVYPKSSTKLFHTNFIKVPVLSRVSAWVTYWKTIEDIVRNDDIDVIVLYAVPTNGMQVLELARKHDIPVVFRSMDILHKLVRNPILSKAVYVLENYVYSHVDLILTNSLCLRDYVIAMSADRDKVGYLPTGIDRHRFVPCGGRGNTIVFVGTLYEFSGLDYFIERFPEILAQVPDAQLVIVGDGKQRKKLEAMVSELRLFRYVDIVGYKPFSMMSAYINSAAVCILPFLNIEITRDIFPVKVLQYLSCGKPVVASFLCGMRTMIEGENQGVVYSRNADDMVDQVISLLKSPERRNELGQVGIKYIEENHDYGKVIDQWEQELSRLVR